MERLLLALVLGLVAVGFALWMQRRSIPTATESVGEFKAPEHLYREDFDGPESPWLVAVFTSATCSTCADVWVKAKALRSPQVAVQEIEETTDAELHRRYDVRAVPIVAIADTDGVVRASFMGPVSATHLWAGLAELRDPGSGPSGCAESAAGPNLSDYECSGGGHVQPTDASGN
ncbi:MAG: hypothetical protein KDB26_01680 [Microthrixaceae bacterium]|nr:hypothetical protein [Microthrixaceae bacterium]